MAEDKQQFQAKPEVPFITNLQVSFSQEYAVLNVFSGNQVYRFALTPEHAKRIKMLLEKQLESFEEKHGELDTKLPETPEGQEQEGSGIGFK